MVKHSRKRSKKQHRKSHKKQTKKMYGGDFSDADRKALIALGFTNQDLTLLEQHNITNAQLIMGSLQQINPETGNNFTPQELIESLNEAANEDLNENEDMNISGISDDSGEQHDLNISGISNDSDNEHNLDDVDDDGSLHLSHLNDSGASDDNNTTRESFGSFGGKKHKRPTKKNKRKTLQNKKRKSKKQKGGQCYGRGVGANTYDPSFSIYNTRELQLFPYKSTN